MRASAPSHSVTLSPQRSQIHLDAPEHQEEASGKVRFKELLCEISIRSQVTVRRRLMVRNSLKPRLQVLVEQNRELELAMRSIGSFGPDPDCRGGARVPDGFGRDLTKSWNFA